METTQSILETLRAEPALFTSGDYDFCIDYIQSEDTSLEQKILVAYAIWDDVWSDAPENELTEIAYNPFQEEVDKISDDQKRLNHDHYHKLWKDFLNQFIQIDRCLEFKLRCQFIE